MKTSITLFIALLFIFASCSKKTEQTTEKKTEQKSEQKTEQKTTETKPANVTTTEFKTAGLHCSGCEQTVTESVQKIDGVVEVKADHKSQTVKVSCKEKCDVSKIEAAIVESGYKVVSHN